jgi:hypothetical protein
MIFQYRSFSFSLARPKPEKECKVVPLINEAAIPVEAVTWTSFFVLFRMCLIISFRRCDFPVPVHPFTKKNTTKFKRNNVNKIAKKKKTTTTNQQNQ